MKQKGLATIDNKSKIEEYLGHTFAVSNPSPVFPPVTMTTLPDRSGISFADQVGFDGKLC
jgi:hypothetical protein